jgi:hypothetical protein
MKFHEKQSSKSGLFSTFFQKNLCMSDTGFLFIFGCQVAKNGENKPFSPHYLDHVPNRPRTACTL